MGLSLLLWEVSPSKLLDRFCGQRSRATNQRTRQHPIHALIQGTGSRRDHYGEWLRKWMGI